ncbi:MAG: hypothetical protein U0441_12860 [Polyangiaceae bacterium]
MMPERARRRELWIAAIALVIGSYLYRLPALVNAEGTNADAAVVGLQAMHILRGEHAAFLWGSGYQTSADSYVAAAWFALLGPTGLALRLSTLTDHVILTLAAFGVLTRRFRPSVAALLAGVLVLTPSTMHTYILYPPRQLALTLAFVGLWIADGAPHGRRRPLLRFAIGCGLGTLACGADPYTLLFLPLSGLWALLIALDTWGVEGGGARLVRTAKRLGAGLAGALIGAVPYVLFLLQARHTEGTLTLNWADVPRRYGLLVEECFPALVSTRVYSYAPDGTWGPYPFSPSFVAVERVGAWLFLAGVASGLALVFVRRIPWSVRRVGLVGAVALPLTLAAFLSSNMIMDRHASRYLVAIVLFAPFALAPAAYLLRGARAAIALTPYLVSVAGGGWTSYRPWTDGLRVDASWGRHEDEWALHRALSERHVEYAIADYWSSYRLGFLWREAIVVVPKAVVEDRYPPQREAFSKAARVAYIHDPERCSESPDDVAAAIAAGKTPFEPTFERLRFGAFTAFVLTRREIAPNLW